MEAEGNERGFGQMISLDESIQSFLIYEMERRRLSPADVEAKLGTKLCGKTVYKILSRKSAGRSVKRNTVYLVGGAIGIAQARLLEKIDPSLVKAAEGESGGTGSNDRTKRLAQPAELAINLKSLKEDWTALAPARYWKQLTTPEQKQAAHIEYQQLIGALQHLAAGRIPLRLDEDAYFEYLLNLALEGGSKNNGSKEKVRIFARLLHLDVCNRLAKLGEAPEPFKRMLTAIKDGRLEFEYVVFLRNRESLTREETRRMLHLYGATASAIYVLFENEGKVTTQETARTIATFETAQCALTHGWSYSGKIEDILWCIRPAECTRLFGIYENLKTKGELCMQNGKLTDQWRHLNFP